jgi:hypothetical protein
VPFFIAFAYVVLCFLTAIIGRPTRAGYWGTFLISLLITPLLAFIFLVLFGPRLTPPGPAA